MTCHSIKGMAAVLSPLPCSPDRCSPTQGSGALSPQLRRDFSSALWLFASGEILLSKLFHQGLTATDPPRSPPQPSTLTCRTLSNYSADGCCLFFQGHFPADISEFAPPASLCSLLHLSLQNMLLLSRGNQISRAAAPSLLFSAPCTPGQLLLRPTPPHTLLKAAAEKFQWDIQRLPRWMMSDTEKLGAAHCGLV